MDAVTTKPITPAHLRAAIAEGLDAASQRHPMASPETATPRLRDLAETLGEDVVAEIIRTFAEDTRAHLVGMLRAATRSDGKALHHAAHSIAGAARNVGADALAQRASTLEETAGLLNPAQIVMEVAAMQADFETVLDRLRVRPGVDV
jgi:HPt (histidine-containing phosphotransfer) domain-containing protein